MEDRWGRKIEYLRLSLTSACQMRCAYCRPSWGCAERAPHEELTPTELHALADHLARHHGLTKIRLTGGDPSARRDLVEIIRLLSSISGLRDLAMTTNGLTLAAHADDYARAGLGRVNVSLDSVRADRFAEITGVAGLHRVIDGIDAALAAGLRPLKINTVVMRGANDDELSDLVAFAAVRNCPIRFIELMPMGPLAAQWSRRFVSSDEMMSRLSETTVQTWHAYAQGSESATRYAATLSDGRSADIGFIRPMSCHFCAACNRLRITSDGAIYPCLMDEPRGSALAALRPQFNPTLFDQLLDAALQQKAAEHRSAGVGVMTQIGG